MIRGNWGTSIARDVFLLAPIMWTTIKSPLVKTLHAKYRGDIEVCTLAVVQVNRIHRCRQVTTNKVKGVAVFLKLCTQSYYEANMCE